MNDYLYNEDTIDWEINSIINKYAPQDSEKKSNSEKVQSIELSSDDDELAPSITLGKRREEFVEINSLRKKIKLNAIENCAINKNINYDITSSEDSDTESSNKNTKKPPVSKTATKAAKLLEKELKKLEKIKEKEKKKEEAQREKALKAALLNTNKNSKPDECLRFISVYIDSEICKEDYGSTIFDELKNMNINYEVQGQLLPRTVTWKRRVENYSMKDNGQLSLSNSTEDVPQLLLIMPWNDVIRLVNEKQLLIHIQNLQLDFQNKTIFLGMYGMGNYFKFIKGGRSRNRKSYDGCPKISRKQLDFALTELQLFCSCCYRFLDSSDDVSTLVVQFTKSIAQIPYKLEKQEKYEQSDWYISADNKDCVRVDKNGNGLQRLWQQQLTAFPLARLETAQAIASKYPTVSNLLEAYENSKSEMEREQLIQDIPIRRAAGPLTSYKKVGPELSKKFHAFFTSTSSDIII